MEVLHIDPQSPLVSHESVVQDHDEGRCKKEQEVSEQQKPSDEPTNQGTSDQERNHSSQPGCTQGTTGKFATSFFSFNQLSKQFHSPVGSVVETLLSVREV